MAEDIRKLIKEAKELQGSDPFSVILNDLYVDVMMQREYHTKKVAEMEAFLVKIDKLQEDRKRELENNSMSKMQ